MRTPEDIIREMTTAAKADPSGAVKAATKELLELGLSITDIVQTCKRVREAA